MVDEQLFERASQNHVVGHTPHLGAPPAKLPSLASITTRMKLAEERYSNLAKRNQITEESLLSFEHDIKAELRTLTRQTVDLRKRMNEINQKVDSILGELNSVVRKHEFAVIDRYIDMWQPMQFLTRDEAKRIIADIRMTDTKKVVPPDKSTTY